ncbi:redoxin domain-containing protein [Citricoccus sp. NR2]|uniref:redoxin domain-containing protein n=1 Tax=Citricoccus sp. NR2 TaxID=3004095 RepID=UPI0022DE4791|nr:redoxin domain-containing protein [Citricoccus sp. NR2]WBL18534.1 redoxin domain-containing protein [Citricoccus sp. NR2]
MTEVPAPTEPRLRDQFGQPWAWPPAASPEGAAADAEAGSLNGIWLVFLPGAFTPVCTVELRWIDQLAQLCSPERIGVRVIAPDAAPVLRAVADEHQITTPLLSDFWPHGAAAQRLGCFDSETGRPCRTSVLITTDGVEITRVVGEPARPRTVEQHVDAMLSAKRPDVG